MDGGTSSKLLFGEKFIKALDKETDLGATVSRIGRYGGHRSNRVDGRTIIADAIILFVEPT